MRRLVLSIMFVVAPMAAGEAQVLLTNGADLDMTGSVGSQIVFPDGTIQSSALESGLALPAGHGGTNNTVSGSLAFIGGGQANVASANYATIGGGRRNEVTANFGFIGGGGDTDAAFGNKVTDRWGTVAGGRANVAGDAAGTIEDASYATVSGGYDNAAASPYAAIAGGQSNTVSFFHGVIGGGLNNNVATGAYGVIGGGSANTVSDQWSTIGGGNDNAAGDNAGLPYDRRGATVAGGIGNTASGFVSTIAGGEANTASSSHTSVVGGYANSATGEGATVLGGYANFAAGDYSIASGRRSSVLGAHDGSFLFADTSDFVFTSSAANEFAVRATGGVRLVSGIDETNSGAPNAGVSLAADATAWGTISARDAKENFTDIDPVAILEKLAALPIQQWNYKAHDPSVKQIGPIAEEFKATFGLNGPYDGTITTLEFDGVALAAIQGVNAKLERELAEKQMKIDALEARLAAIEARLPTE